MGKTKTQKQKQKNHLKGQHKAGEQAGGNKKIVMLHQKTI